MKEFFLPVCLPATCLLLYKWVRCFFIRKIIFLLVLQPADDFCSRKKTAFSFWLISAAGDCCIFLPKKFLCMK